ncbi:MAG: hypothetical protein ACOC92_01805 [bacterium]
MPELSESRYDVIRHALRLFEQLGQEKTLALAEEVPDSVSYPLDPTDTAKRLAISEDDAGTALTTLVWLATGSNPEEDLAGFPESTGRSIAMAVAERLRAEPLRTEIKHAVAKAQLANRVLPSVRAVDVVVDARVDTKDNEVIASVPVALVAILTDLESSLRFQMTAKQVRILAMQLNDALQQMETVEKWASR